MCGRRMSVDFGRYLGVLRLIPSENPLSFDRRPSFHARAAGTRGLYPIRWHRLQFAAEPRPHMGILSWIRLDSPPLGRQRRLHMPTTSTAPRAAAAALLVPGTTCHGFAVERRETVP